MPRRQRPPSKAEVERKYIQGLARSRIYDEEKVFLREKRKTIEAAVKCFKRRKTFLATMAPVGPLMKDPISAEFITGVLTAFDDVEEHGAEWLYEDVK